jgi:hypothetical protein
MSQEVYTYHRPGKFWTQNEKYMQENIIEKVLVNKVEPDGRTKNVHQLCKKRC